MKTFKILIIFLLLTLLNTISLFCQKEEFIIKTALVEKFARFTEWPANSNIKDSSENFIIGLFGKAPLGGDIKGIFKKLNIKIKDKTIVFRQFKKVKDIEPVHILLISSKSKVKLKGILKFTADNPTLIISDNKGFGKIGVHINFYYDKGRIRFEINETAVHKSKLSMSYLLLRAAKIINKWKKT